MKTKKNIKKICVFDFDQTLMLTPQKKLGIMMWEKYYKEIYPSKKWWSEPSSLDLNVFNYYIKPNFKIIKDYLTNIKRYDTWVILLTHRNVKLKKEINKILNKYDIFFDDKIFRTSYTINKAMDLEDYIVDFSNLEKIEIWEDNDNEIKTYNKWAYKVEPWLRIDIKIHVVKNLYENN